MDSLQLIHDRDGKADTGEEVASHPVTNGNTVQLKARMGSNVFYFENLQDWDPPSLPLPKRTLVIGLAAIPSNLHPLINALQVTRYIHSFISRSVTRLDEHGNTTSQLCTETPSLENGRVLITDRPDGTQGMEVTFTLRPGLRWGDGSPLTTRDIVFSARVERLFHIIPHLAESSP